MDVELADLLIVLMLHSASITFWSILVIIPSLLNCEDNFTASFQSQFIGSLVSVCLFLLVKILCLMSVACLCPQLLRLVLELQ